MDRTAILVDAGYLCTGGSVCLTGSQKKRGDIRLDVPQLFQVLTQKAADLSGLSLLRVYWYDGALPGGLTTEQQLIGQTAGFKLRLGVVNGYGEQKGVDAKIVTDLAELARNRAIADAILVGGDEDLRIGVELAQQYGARVHLLTIDGTGVSASLKMEADGWVEIDANDVSGFMTITVPQAAAIAQTLAIGAPAINAAAHDTCATVFYAVVSEYLEKLDATERAGIAAAITGANGKIPAEHDGRMLAQSGTALGRDLNLTEKHQLRGEIRSQLGVSI